MLLFIQPYGTRILRSLIQNAPVDCMSASTELVPPPKTDLVEEVHLALRQSCGRIEYSRAHRFLGALDVLFSGSFRRRLKKLCLEKHVTAMHCIAHQLDFVPAFAVAKELDIPYFLTVHDHIEYLRADLSLGSILGALPEVWTGAAHRYVITNELGEEYCRRFGRVKYDVVTDCVTGDLHAPLKRVPGSLRVYFMGQIHLNYRPNFQALVSALDLLAAERAEDPVGLTLRGIDSYPLDSRASKVITLPWGSQEDVMHDMDNADLVYLPMPFMDEPKNRLFCRFSLSTKMVTYLDSGLPLIYHGPVNSAAYNLLAAHRAAILITSLDAAEIRAQLQDQLPCSATLVENALRLGRKQFTLDHVRQTFWSPIVSRLNSK
jgi:hypothetical protein